MNVIIVFLILISLNTLTVFTASKGKIYIFSFISGISVFSFFISSIVIDVFGYPFLFAEIIFAVLYLGTDILTENWGKKTARNVIWAAILVLTIMVIFMQALSFLTPHPIDKSLFHIIETLIISPRIMFAAIFVFLIEQQFDIWLFHRLKKLTNGKKLWVRNLFSTSATQMLDVIIFYPLAFYGVYENLIDLMVSAYIFKFLMAILDTPFIYLNRYFFQKHLQLEMSE